MPRDLPPIDRWRRLGSSWRSRSVRETMATASALMGPLGISRVTDITRMDRLGLPVFVSVRPRGKAIHVHAGKGVRPDEARIGALMEAIELAVAEPAYTRWPARRMSVAELASQLPAGIRVVDFAPRYGLKIQASTVVTTVGCVDVATGRDVQVPAELVFVPYAPPPPEQLFSWGTTGLASGNSVDEATLHAVLEVLERDALVMNRPHDASCRVDPAELPAPFRDLAEAWQRLGVALAVRQVPNVLSLPCFEAVLHEPASADVNLASGSGLHLDRDIALARAVCEAAQSRLSCIHGGRDDVTTFYSKFTAIAPADRQALEAAVVAGAFSSDRSIRYDAVGPPATVKPSGRGVLDELLGRLREAGFPSVLRHRFDADLGGVHVVKVIVPRCEEMETAHGRVGPRLLECIARDG